MAVLDGGCGDRLCRSGISDARQKIESGALRRLMEDFADAEVGCVSGELMLGDPE
jgi:hypothetical protein